MAEAMKLPLTFQKSTRRESESDPVISSRANEVRALSSAYLPTEATAELREDGLLIKYIYDTDERSKYTPEDEKGFKILLGAVTGRVLEIRVQADEEGAFRKRIESLTSKLHSWNKTPFRKRHYEIIASSLEVFKELALQEGLM